jgi:hypothetical protein
LQVRYESRKRLADTRPRIRGQFVKAEVLLKMQQQEAQEGEGEDRMEVDGEEVQQPPLGQELPQQQRGRGRAASAQGDAARHGQQHQAELLPPLPPAALRQQGRQRSLPSQQQQQQHLVGAKRRKSTPGRSDY